MAPQTIYFYPYEQENFFFFDRTIDGCMILEREQREDSLT